MIAGTTSETIPDRHGSVSRTSPRHGHNSRSQLHRKSDQPRTINVALLGCGVVGREVARSLIEQRDLLNVRIGLDVRLTHILVRDRTRDRGMDDALLTDQFDEVLRSKPDVIIEALGGLDPAGAYVERSLSNGIDVITANKTLVAYRGPDLHAVAARSGSHLLCEATVCAAVPVLTAIQRLRGDRIRAITGIVNGTCNSILTRMTDDGLELEQALDEARSLGLVEPDPSADLSGRDSAEKLTILACIAGAARLRPENICVHGIEHITHRDIQAAKRLGCVIKLIARVALDESAIRAWVCPTLLPRRHPLATVRLQNNAVILDCEHAGALLLQGLGAGPKPTAAAIIADLIQLQSSRLPQPLNFCKQQTAGEIDVRCIVRLTPDIRVKRPDALLASLQGHGLAVREIECSHDEVRFASDVSAISRVESAVHSFSRAKGDPAFIAIDGRTHLSFSTLSGSCDAICGRSFR